MAVALACYVTTVQAQVVIAPTMPPQEAVKKVAATTVAASSPLFCSCISYVHSLDKEFPLVNADELTPNTSLALVHNVVLLRYPKSGLSHVAFITDKEADGVWVTEANYVKCKKSERFISFTDPHIVGYWTDK